ncbi:MAG: flavodoxin [Eggerthellales bacterium]|nr:flavodoxin [Eggerthellales bacterium]
MSKILVAYFSAGGNTAKLAQRVAKAADADLFEIVPRKPYTSADLNWRDKNSRTTIEMNDPASRPEVASHVENMAQYDTIFLGFPIWWYVAPTLINTFLEQYDLEGKTIVPFATSGGSGMGQTVTMLKVSAPKATIEAGAVMNMAMDGKIKKFVEHYL